MDNTVSLSQLQSRVTPESRPARPVSASPVNVTQPASSAQPTKSAQPTEPVVSGAELGKDLRESLEALSARLNEFVQSNARELEFMVGDEAGRVVILVRQSETGEVVRTIPPEEAVSLSETLREGGAALFSQKA